MAAKRLLGEEQLQLFENLGILESIFDKIHAQAMVITAEDEHGGEVLVSASSWVDSEIEVTLDSGCVDHILDLGDAPGYEAFIAESPGSKRGQRYVVGNGGRVPNEGQLVLNLEHDVKSGSSNLLRSTFQVAEVTRPLMSVSRICDLGMKVIFDSNEALVVNAESKTIAKFMRRGGLYIAQMRLKPPECFPGPATR